MGHQLEYLLELAPPDARQWLSRFDGFWVETDTAGELPTGEFCLWDGLDLFADLGPTACWVRVPQIKYSWLIADYREIMAQVARLESLLEKSLPGVLAVRVDEFVRMRWEAEAGRSWAQLPDAVHSLRSWLVASGQDQAHYRIIVGQE